MSATDPEVEGGIERWTGLISRVTCLGCDARAPLVAQGEHDNHEDENDVDCRAIDVARACGFVIANGTWRCVDCYARYVAEEGAPR